MFLCFHARTVCLRFHGRLSALGAPAAALNYTSLENHVVALRDVLLGNSGAVFDRFSSAFMLKTSLQQPQSVAEAVKLLLDSRREMGFAFTGDSSLSFSVT